MVNSAESEPPYYYPSIHRVRIVILNLGILTSCRSLGLGDIVSHICLLSNIEHIPISFLAWVGYWCSLGSSQDFTGQTLESCLNVIREDITNVWNFEDEERVCRSF